MTKCGELLTDALCVRRKKHEPPHSSERRFAELLDERDELKEEIVVLRRERIAMTMELRMARGR